MEFRNTNFVFLAMMLFQGAKALTCPDDTLKVTIKALPDEYDFDEYEEYEMRATIAYSVQKYCGENLPDCGGVSTTTIASDVILYNITERVSMCVEVVDFNPATVRKAIKLSKANLNGALLLTDNDLYVDGLPPTLSPVPQYDFAPWLIAYIVIFSLIILGGVAIVLYTKCRKSDDSEEKEEMLGVEEGSVGDVTGSTNNAYEEIGPAGKIVEEKSSNVYKDERDVPEADQATEQATAL